MAAAMDIVPTSDEFIGTLDRLRKRGKFMQKVFYQGTMDVKRDELLTEEKDMWGALQSPLSSEKRFFDIFSYPARFEKVMNVLKQLAYLQRKISFYRWHANYAAQVFAPPAFTYTDMETQMTTGQREVWKEARTLGLGGRDGGDVREVYYYWLKTQIEEAAPSSLRHQFFAQLRQAIIEAPPFGRRKVHHSGLQVLVLQGNMKRWLALQAVGAKFEAPLYSTWQREPPGSLEQAEKLQFRM
jgi:hypothetical protein